MKSAWDLQVCYVLVQRAHLLIFSSLPMYWLCGMFATLGPAVNGAGLALLSPTGLPNDFGIPSELDS